MSQGSQELCCCRLGIVCLHVFICWKLDHPCNVFGRCWLGHDHPYEGIIARVDYCLIARTMLYRLVIVEGSWHLLSVLLFLGNAASLFLSQWPQKVISAMGDSRGPSPDTSSVLFLLFKHWNHDPNRPLLFINTWRQVFSYRHTMD